MLVHLARTLAFASLLFRCSLICQDVATIKNDESQGPSKSKVDSSLNSALESIDASRRATALRKIRAEGRSGAIEAEKLVSLLQTDPDASVRIEAAATCSAFLSNDRDVLFALGRALVEDQDAGVRISVAVSIGRHKTDRQMALALLLSGLVDKDTDVRATAIQSIGGMDQAGAMAVPFLLPLFTDLSDRHVWISNDVVDNWPLRRDAILAVGRIAAPGDKVVMSHLKQAMKDDDDFVRVAAAISWRRLNGDAGTAIEILEVCSKSDNVRARLHAVGSIGIVSDSPQRIAAMLTQTLQDEDPSVRLRTVTAIGELESVLPLMRDVLSSRASHDVDGRVREACKDVLGDAEDTKSQRSEPQCQ